MELKGFGSKILKSTPSREQKQVCDGVASSNLLCQETYEKFDFYLKKKNFNKYKYHLKVP